MRLFIAEKPSLAKAIAAVLPQPHRPGAGFIECGGGDVVAWCAGHILEQAPPDEYDERYKAWRLDDLPIAPAEWKLVVKTPDLLRNIKGLLKRAERVVHAGDPDREGQLLVDEVLVYLGYRGPVDRILISDLNPPAVKKALAELQPNSRFRRLYETALARQRADWLYGLNMTRLYTLLGRAGGYDSVLSVGRVQTPVLGLVVRRDLEIERFRPRPFFAISAKLTSSAGSFTAAWQPGASAEQFLDEEGRLISRERAVDIQRATSGQAGHITRSARERKAEAPPLPYSLADLQVDASRRLRLSAKETLDACQRLYETHRLTTYPRSDCSFLPEGHLQQAAQVAAAIGKNAPHLLPLTAQADLNLRSRAWNDGKVTAHHAIIPTPSSGRSGDLDDREKAVYDLIARRYLAQFHPAHEFDQVQLEATIAGERFLATGRQILSQGWRAVLGDSPDEDAHEEDPSPEDRSSSSALPALEEGAHISALEVSPQVRQTKPPRRFTDGSLLQAMSGINRFVSDPKIRQILKETDGIGTPATQAQIIETLFERQFLEKKGRQIVSTPTGRALIATLPDVATRPDMTALWEAAMRQIHDGKGELEEFIHRVLTEVTQLVERGKHFGALEVPGARPCPRPGCGGFFRRRKSKSGEFWACTRYPYCRQTADHAAEAPENARAGRRAHRRP